MDQLALKTLLNTLIGTWENEVVEFKQADENYKTDKIGEYFSALSNEANLSGQESAWLVFGVNNKTRAISGTHYREEADRLNGLKHQIAQSTEPSVTFRNIHVLEDTASRVVLFEIPAAPRGIPIAWKGHYYSRAGESLVPLGFAKQDEIRQQTIAEDWTAQPVSSATFEDLDEAALQRARKAFAKKYANRFAAEEVEAWPLSTFLDRARVTQNGAITRTTLLLLGKPESTWKLSPHPAQMTWKLEGPERAYEHFSPPFLLSTSWLYRRIRNIQLRLLPQDELLPIEVAKYDQKIVLESLHNCIAHQDYTRNGRVIVIEQPDRLVFENEGMFFEGQPGDYLEGNRVPRKYRNPFLAQAMAELNMIDTMGFGMPKSNSVGWYCLKFRLARAAYQLLGKAIITPERVKASCHWASPNKMKSASKLLPKTGQPSQCQAQRLRTWMKLHCRGLEKPSQKSTPTVSRPKRWKRGRSPHSWIVPESLRTEQLPARRYYF